LLIRGQVTGGDGQLMCFSETDDSYSMSNLTDAGRVVVTAMRKAPSGAAATMACFVDAFGEKRGRPCFVVFLQIVHSLALFGRRRMRVGKVSWPILTHDEVAFVRCIDAEFRGDRQAFDALVTWLVRQRGAAELGGYMETLAQLMPEPMLQAAPEIARGGRFGAGTAARPAAKRPARRRPAPAFPVAVE
jgi:hypothetical protein